jgi:hypothetical protein
MSTEPCFLTAGEHLIKRTTLQHLQQPQLAKLDMRHGPRLIALACELVWATA